MYRSKEINKAIKNFKQGTAAWENKGEKCLASLFKISSISQLLYQLEIEQVMSLGTLIGAYTGEIKDPRSNDIKWTRTNLRDLFAPHKDMINKHPFYGSNYIFDDKGKKMRLYLEAHKVKIHDGNTFDVIAEKVCGSCFEALNEFFDVVDQVDGKAFDIEKWSAGKVGLDAQIKQADEVKNNISDKTVGKVTEKER